MTIVSMSGRFAAGLLLAATCALPQAYTISAKPGAVNFVEGSVTVNGKTISPKSDLRLFLGANEVLETGPASRAEILLTPGVFVRVAANSQVKMISPRLVDTQFELQKGEAAVEVGELEKDNSIQVVDDGVTSKLQKTGLYRFTVSDPGAIQVLDGEAAIQKNEKRIEIKKNHALLLASDETKPVHFDPKSIEDDLYAWSKVRDEYESASSFAAARAVNVSNSFSNTFNGFGGYYGGPGWFWNAGWNSWSWLPGSGAFFSPFGFGYFSPVYAMYAPIVYAPVVAGGLPVAVPVNPNAPLAVAGVNKAPVTLAGVRMAGQPRFPVGSGGGRVSQATLAAHVSNVNGGGPSYAGRGGYSGPMVSTANASAPRVAAAPSAGHAAGGGPSHR